MGCDRLLKISGSNIFNNLWREEGGGFEKGTGDSCFQAFKSSRLPYISSVVWIVRKFAL